MPMTVTWSSKQNRKYRLSRSSKAFILTTSLDKTVDIFQPPLGSPYIRPSIFVDGHKLKSVDKFIYL